MIDFTVIVLTYKRKILLTFKETNPNIIDSAIWHFIGGIKQKNKSEQESIKLLIEKKTGIKLSSIEFLSKRKSDNITEHFYRAELTDEDVNNMKREEGQVINFYSVDELKKLLLSNSTKRFISTYPELLKSLSNN